MDLSEIPHEPVKSIIPERGIITIVAHDGEGQEVADFLPAVPWLSQVIVIPILFISGRVKRWEVEPKPAGASPNLSAALSVVCQPSVAAAGVLWPSSGETRWTKFPTPVKSIIWPVPNLCQEIPHEYGQVNLGKDILSASSALAQPGNSNTNSVYKRQS